MDGEPVKGEPSTHDQTGGSNGDAAARFTYTELFMKVFPEYMAMGMTYDEFWRDTPYLAYAYRKAYEIRQRHEEWARWRQGAYIYDAMLRVAPVMRASMSKARVEPGEYPNEPWPLTQKEVKEREAAKEKAKYMKWIADMEAASALEIKKREAKKKGGEEVGRDRESIDTD